MTKGKALRNACNLLQDGKTGFTKSGFLRSCVFFYLASALSGCAITPLKTIEMGDALNYKHRVLIATQKSPFKEAMVSQIIDDLEKELCWIRMIDLSKLENEPIEHYDAIFIVNTCMARNLSLAVQHFLETGKGRGKTVLLTTASGEICGPTPAQVDAVTSASKVNNASRVAREIVAKVRAIFASHPPRPPLPVRRE